jgi:hypothetical protein
MRSGSTALRDMGCQFVASGINLFDYWGGLGCSPKKILNFVSGFIGLMSFG